ncbi:MAG: S8 family serine peptidase, partial [Clostridia bacterium]|nr:S8 family serine peptidase [Clostridia bacterium]
MKKFKKLISALLVLVMVMSFFSGLSVQAVGESFKADWIVEFENTAVAKEYAEVLGGSYLGGGFVLVHESKAELSKHPILSFTANDTVKGSSVSNITDEYASDQYILTHKSLYAKDGWSKLETALANLETPLTPADCATVRVAVIDSGIDGTHEDLKGRVIDGYDAVNKVAISKDENSDISNDSHGTKVAGLIGAASDNAIGVAGMAWTFPVELMPVRVLDNNNNGKMADVITAIYWAVDEGEADIINISFGKSLKSVPVALQEAVLHAVDNGVIVVCAAGNNNSLYKNGYYPFYPAALEGVLPVGSTAKELYKSGSYTYVQKASFSNKPYVEYDCAETFFFTPGEELLTTAKGNTYEEFTGTSASSAVFSGMIAAFKSFADTTGKGDVLNYIGHGKYSYLGALYYEDYYNIASYLVNGQGAYKTAFYFYEYTPAYVFGQVELEGILNDTEMKYESVSFYFDGVLVDTVERNEYSKQHIVFNWDTTQFEDGWYGTDAPVIMGTLPDGTEEEIDSDDSYIYFTIGNNEEKYIVKVLSDGTPVKGADATLYNMSNETTGYTTNTLGQIYISPEDIDDDTSMIVVGDGIIMYRALEQSPLNNEYIFGANPSMLTVKVGDEKLEKLKGSTVYAIMPDGAKIELATIEENETIINIDTDTLITFNVSGPGMIINEEIDLSEGDYTWDLDTVTGGEIVISADSQETDNAPESLGVIIDDYDMVLLGAEGGSITLSAGKYHVYGVVKYADTSYYKVDLGNVVVTEGEETAVTIGIGELAGQLKISPETVTEGENVTLDYILKDSEGNTVVGLGYMDEDGYCYGGDYAEIMIEAYDGETGEWMEVNYWGDRVRPTDSYFTRFILDRYALGDGIGKKRVTLMGSYLNEKLADETVEFEVLSQETRPHAVVTFEMYNAYEYTLYDVVAATLVENEEGETILRKAFSSDDGPMIRLPVGKKYTVALIGNDYDQMYITKAEVDLTETENGETVTVTVPYSEDEWSQSTVMGEEADNGMCFVSGLAFKPFAESDSIIGVNNQLMDNLCTIHAKGMGTVELLFTLSPDFYECENYEYPPVFTIKKKADLSEGGEIMLGTPHTASVKVEVKEQNATITPYITDAFGNEIIRAEYQSRYPKMEGGDGGMEGGIAPAMSYPVIKVYNSEAEEIYTKTTKFEKIDLERLEIGAYAATLIWDSSDIHPESEQVNFTIGETEEEAPVIGTPVAPPTNFRAKATDRGVVLTWTKSVSEIAHYFIYRDGELLCELGDVDTYTDTNPGDSGYKVYTIYAANEEGERSDGVTAGVRLIPAEDNEAPIWGDGAEILATAEDGGVSLKWSRATDEGTGVTYYTLYCNGEEIAQKFTRTHTYNGLMPDVDYTFTVTATDGNGNVSEELESEPVSIESGILGHNLVYAKNRLGYMTGTAFTAVVNTTGDIESLTGEIKYTLSGGESKTEDVEFSGANGYFTWSKTFEATLTSIDALTVKYEDGYECIESPILRKMAKVKVNVELSDLAEIYPRGTLALYSKSLDYAYTYPVTNMEGTIEDTIIAAADYTVTLAGGNGQVLVNEKHSITEDTEITLDENSIRLLKVVLESPQTGFTVTLESDNGAVAGVSNDDGTIIWQNGSEWISVGENATLKNEKFFYSEKLTLENGINVKTIAEKVTDTYEPVTAHIRVKDTYGNYLNNVRVEFATSVDKTNAVTDEDGSCEAELVKNKWYDHVYINIPEQKQRERVILNKKTTVNENGTTEVVVEIGYEDIEIIPILDMEADIDKVTFTLDGEKISLYEGKLYQRRTSGCFKKDENLELSAEYTADGVSYKGIASFTRSETQPQEVNLEMKRLVDVKLSLTDNGDVLKGTKRYYKIYDSKSRVVDSFSTYDAVSTVKLMEGNFYTASAGWGLNTGSERFMAREGLEVTLELKHNGFMYEAFGSTFLAENGFTAARSVSLNKNGDIYVKADFTSWYIRNPDVSEAYNYIVLPEGAENVEFEGLYEYDSASHTIRIKYNLAELGWHYYIDTLSFTIPSEKLTEDAMVASHLKFVYDGEAYTSDNNGFSLMDYAMALYAPERASVSEAKDGVKVSVSLPLAKKGTLEIYDGTSLVASSATDEGKIKYDFNIKPSNSIGSHTIKAVYTADEVSLTRQRTLTVVDDGRPVVKTAEVGFDSNYLGNILNPTKALTYQVSSGNIAYCTATFTNPDKVEKAWLVGKTDSEFDRVELFRKPGTDQFTGRGRLGDATNYVTALRIEFEEAPLTIEDMEDVIYGDFEWDYEHIVPVVGSEAMEMYASLFDAKTYEGFDYGPYYGQSEESQAKAMEDWNTYVQMVNNGVFEKDEAEAEAEFAQLFGEDNTWEIPSVTNGKEYFQKSFKYDPDKIEEKLNSQYAFSVNINGEKRKVLIEVEIVGDEMYIVYYGLGDLLMPRVPQIDTDTVSGAGVDDKIDDWTKKGVEAWDKWKNYGQPINDLLDDDDDDDGGGGGGGGSPCSGGESEREKRRKEVDKAFDEGWELAKETGGLLSWMQFGGFSGGGIAPDLLLDDDGVGHKLFELQRDRIHQIDDIIDDMNPDPPGG